LDRRLGGLQSRSGRSSEQKNSQPLPGLEPQIIQPVAQRYIPELSRNYAGGTEEYHESESGSRLRAEIQTQNLPTKQQDCNSSAAVFEKKKKKKKKKKKEEEEEEEEEKKKEEDEKKKKKKKEEKEKEKKEKKKKKKKKKG
jgi:hypothetical protein